LLGEAFNLWNHQNVTGVNTTAYTITNTVGPTPATNTATLVYQPSFASITSANNLSYVIPRQIQISARFVF
jgi:hypothetical protein